MFHEPIILTITLSSNYKIAQTSALSYFDCLIRFAYAHLASGYIIYMLVYGQVLHGHSLFNTLPNFWFFYSLKKKKKIKVSWLRKRSDDLELLTVGGISHSSDPRIQAEFVYPQHWPLQFQPALVNDTGCYMCQISSDPPIVRFVYFNVSGEYFSKYIIKDICDNSVVSKLVFFLEHQSHDRFPINIY